jgi:hypothetical protein
MDTKTGDILPQVMRMNLSQNSKFESSYETTDPHPKRKVFPSSRSASRVKIAVAIEADNCDELTLKYSDDYINKLMDIPDCRSWFERKKAQKKAVYLVVGYIIYVNARVSQNAAGDGVSSQISAGSLSGVNVGASISARSSPSLNWRGSSTSTASVGSNATSESSFSNGF